MIEHPHDKESTTHNGEQLGIIFLFVLVLVLFCITMVMSLNSNTGQAERLDAIEFQLGCEEHQRFINVDGELFCKETE